MVIQEGYLSKKKLKNMGKDELIECKARIERELEPYESLAALFG